MRVDVAPTASTPEAAPALRSRHDPLLQLGARPSSGHLLFRVALQAGLLGVAVLFLLAGLIGMTGSVVPLAVGMVLTGMLAALLYHRRAGPALPAAKSAQLGATAGVIALAAMALIAIVAVALVGTQEDVREEMVKAINQSAGSSDPRVQTFLQSLQSPRELAIALAEGILLAMPLSMIFSAIGSVIAFAFLRNRVRPPW